MKVRNGFVSNSSSSSFIVVGKQPPGVSVKLTEKQISEVVRYIEEDRGLDLPIEVNRKPGEDVYLTSFISDATDFYDEFTNKELEKHPIYSYCDGGHGGPWDSEGFDCLLDNNWESVWILKEHNGGVLSKQQRITMYQIASRMADAELSDRFINQTTSLAPKDEEVFNLMLDWDYVDNPEDKTEVEKKIRELTNEDQMWFC